jgi:hypothetical protein
MGAVKGQALAVVQARRFGEGRVMGLGLSRRAARS